jgi:hypothetical protein
MDLPTSSKGPIARGLFDPGNVFSVPRRTVRRGIGSRALARKTLDFGVRDQGSAGDLDEADLTHRGQFVDSRSRNAKLRRSVVDPPCGWSESSIVAS